MEQSPLRGLADNALTELSLNDISKQGPDKPSRISTFGKFRLG